MKTWIDPEEMAYPNGGFTRNGQVLLRQNPHNPINLPYGSLRRIKCSIPDTFFTIPARLRYRGKTIKGYISQDEGVLIFTPEADPVQCILCPPFGGCRK